MGALEAGLDFAGSLVDTASNIFNSERNFNLQNKAYNEQRRLNDYNIDWHNNKYFYTAKDLANTGLSKAALLNSSPSNAVALHSGQPAQANSVTNFGGLYSKYLNNLNLSAQESVLKSTSAKADAETSYIQKKELLAQEKIVSEKLSQKISETTDTRMKQEIRNLKLEFNKMFHDLTLSENQNIRTTDAVNSLYNTLNSAAGALDSEIIDTAIDVVTIILPGAAAFKGAKLGSKFLPFLKTLKDKGLGYVKKNYHKVMKGLGLKDKDIPPASDMFG